MLDLLRLKHGKSDWNVPVDDFLRPLKERGKRGAQRIGAWLGEQSLVPDYILSSPAERACTTAEKCIKAMGGGIGSSVTQVCVSSLRQSKRRDWEGSNKPV